ncbi:MAG: amidohydrolase [Desulforhopalus sp.]
MKTADKQVSPEVILCNGTIHGRMAQGLAIHDGRIVAIGDDNDICGLAGKNTETVNVGGRLILPGFIDTHIHFHEWAIKRQGLRLDDVSTLDELLDRVVRQADNISASDWIIGQGWNETNWPEKRIPNRDDLDRAAPDNPLLLWRCDLHLAIANSAALAKASIGKETVDPPQGRIERDSDGKPTGVLRELAINLVRDAIEPPDTAGIVSAYQEATQALYRVGITGIHYVRLMDDSDGGRALRAFYELDRTGRLGLRSWVTLPGNRLDELIGLGIRSGFGNDRLRLGHVKFFSDGGVGARTAWMIEPYLDADHGMSMMDMDVLAGEIEKADRAGLSVMVHAIGDRANREVIGIFERLYGNPVPEGAPRPAYPHRLEHLQTIRPIDVERLSRLPIALGVTPANLLLDIDLIDTVLGGSGRWSYAFRDLFDTGCPLMFSSDCPVCNPDPLLGIHAAVTRKKTDGTPAEGWYPQAAMNVIDSIHAYTLVPARVHGEGDLGVIDIHKKADLAVFSRDFLSGAADEIRSAKVEMTIFDGAIVYRDF